MNLLPSFPSPASLRQFGLPRRFSSLPLSVIPPSIQERNFGSLRFPGLYFPSTDQAQLRPHHDHTKLQEILQNAIMPAVPDNTENLLPTTAAQPDNEVKPKKKMCCACPETKKVRDECVILNGEEACQSFIDAHKQCLRSEGFNV